MEHGTRTLPAEDGRFSREWSELSRRFFLRGIGVACLGMVPLLQACDNAFSRGASVDGSAGTGGLPGAMMPPIDATAPTETQTATFALG